MIPMPITIVLMRTTISQIAIAMTLMPITTSQIPTVPIKINQAHIVRSAFKEEVLANENLVTFTIKASSFDSNEDELYLNPFTRLSGSHFN